MADLERAPSLLPPQELAPEKVENTVEQEPRVPELTSQQPVAQVEVTSTQSHVSLPIQQPVPKDPRAGMLKDVEALLADGLMQLYMSLPESRRAAFKQKGEDVANKITDMILYGKAKVREVWRMIGEWLRTVPGVNKYFLEQEIKIKTDRIMMYAESAHQ